MVTFLIYHLYLNFRASFSLGVTDVTNAILALRASRYEGHLVTVFLKRRRVEGAVTF